MSDCNNLKYSKEAIESKALFYNKKAIVYVEGPDDIPFWSEYFDDFNYEIQDVNGCENLKQYVDLLINGSTTFIVAMDRDYSDFIENSPKEVPLLVKTYTHSIENDMYCPTNVNWMLRRITKSQYDFMPDIETWINEWERLTRNILALDIASNICGNGKQICGDTCYRFLNSAKSAIQESSIKAFINETKTQFDNELVEDILKKFSRGERKPIQIIKGHFYASGMQAFIRAIVKRRAPHVGTYSNDALNSLAVTCIRRCEPICKSKKYLEDVTTKAKNSLTA